MEQRKYPGYEYPIIVVTEDPDKDYGQIKQMAKLLPTPQGKDRYPGVVLITPEELSTDQGKAGSGEDVIAYVVDAEDTSSIPEGARIVHMDSTTEPEDLYVCLVEFTE